DHTDRTIITQKKQTGAKTTRKKNTITQHSQSDKNQNTSIAPMLSVRRGAKAVEFYKAAFGAGELFRLDNDSGEVVAQLSVGAAQFWVADESPENLNFSPQS